MRLDGLPVLSALKDALDYSAARSRVLASNIANSDTPGYVPKDIAEGDFESALAASQSGSEGGERSAGGGQMLRTDPRHLAPPQDATRGWRVEEAPDTELTLDGNGVVLEEQMSKVAETRMRYEAAIGLYEKTLSLIRLAAKAPGR